MAFRIATGILGSTGSSGPVVMPAGTIATDHVLIAYGVAFGTGLTMPVVTITGLGAGSWGEVVAMHPDNNMAWGLYEVWGVTAGQTVTVGTTGTAHARSLQAWVFTADIGAPGGLGSRGGTSNLFNTIPGRAVTAGAKMLIFSTERTTAATTLSSVTVSSGETVTQLTFAEETGTSDSFYLGEYTTGVNPSGIATVTYSNASGNGGGVQIVEVAGNEAIPSIAPVFGQSGVFTLGASVPGLPGQFKTASPIVSAPDTISIAVPSGTIASDWVYVVTTWGNGTVRTVTITDPPARLPAAQVIPSRHDANVGWNIQAMTGLAAGDVIKLTLADGSPSASCCKLFVFDAKLSQPGIVGSRVGGVATTVVPGTAVVPLNPVYIFAVERTTADGTLVTNAVNANGSTVNQVAFDEYTGDPDITYYLGQLTPTTANSGDTTLTYNMLAGSGNSGGVTIPAVAAPANCQPIFGPQTLAQKLFFSIKVTPAPGLIRTNLGRPDSHTIRVATYTQAVSSVRLAVATGPAMLTPLFSPATVPDADGYSHLEVSALNPDTDYYWQIEVGGVLTGSVNQCRTWPQEGSIVPVCAIEVGSCTKGFGTMNGPSNPGTFTHMAARVDSAGRKARLWVDLGDDFYPYLGTGPLGPVFPPSAQGIRNLWEAQHGQSQRTAFHKAIPTSHTYSDNDFTGSNSDSTIVPETAGIVNRVRRQVLADGPFGSTDGKGLYWSALLGRVLIIQTDGRTYTSNNLLPNSTAGKSMLGVEQKAWLKDQFLRTDKSAIIWCHDNQWVGNPGTSSARPGLDNWQAFSVERQEIADFITANQVPILLYCHGDNHGFAFDDGTNNAYGHFPFTMTAPVYQDAYLFTGGATGGAYPTVNITNAQFFTWLEITDDGTNITVRVDNIDATSGVPLVKLTNTATVAAARPATWLMHEFYRNIEAADVAGLTTGDGGTGVQGPPGPQGPQGVAGPAGKDGAVWWNGVGPPTPPPVASKAGDYYLNTSNGDVYLLT